MNINAATQLAYQKMREHGLLALGWKFELDNAVKRFGLCSYRSKTISMSQKLIALNDEARVLDTILHEIAHALVGAGHGHDNVWKRKCIEIGAKPRRCYSSENTTTPKLKYVAVCGNCQHEHQRAKRPDPLMKFSCKCQSHLPWSLRKILVYNQRNSLVTS